MTVDSDNDHINENEISLGSLINWFLRWVRYLFSKWWQIGVGSVVILLLIVAFNYLKPKVYFSKISFVLENESTSSLGGISSLASVAGINLGSLSDGNTLFQIDNIQELYRSNRMIENTLLESYSFATGQEIIVSKLIKELKWDEELSEQGISMANYSLNREQFSRAQDSVLIEVTDLVREKFLHVAKPNRKTSILEVGFYSEDESLAKAFNEIHVQNVNEFYKHTKSKKASISVQTLKRQTDSVKHVLDKSILTLAELDESVPNPNPLYKTSQVPYQKALIDVQASSAVYQELVTQLELAKITLRNNTPLIQVIDSPVYPLQHNQWKLFKTLVIGVLIGLSLMLLYFTLKRMFAIALNN